MKVKIFQNEDRFDSLEDTINDWLLKNNVDVFKILQSETASDDERGNIFNFLTITIFYKEVRAQD